MDRGGYLVDPEYILLFLKIIVARWAGTVLCFSDLGLAEASRFRLCCCEHHSHPILMLLLTRNTLLASTRHRYKVMVSLTGMKNHPQINLQAVHV